MWAVPCARVFWHVAECKLVRLSAKRSSQAKELCSYEGSWAADRLGRCECVRVPVGRWRFSHRPGCDRSATQDVRNLRTAAHFFSAKHEARHAAERCVEVARASGTGGGRVNRVTQTSCARAVSLRPDLTRARQQPPAHHLHARLLSAHFAAVVDREAKAARISAGVQHLLGGHEPDCARYTCCQ